MVRWRIIFSCFHPTNTEHSLCVRCSLRGWVVPQEHSQEHLLCNVEGQISPWLINGYHCQDKSANYSSGLLGPMLFSPSIVSSHILLYGLYIRHVGHTALVSNSTSHMPRSSPAQCFSVCSFCFQECSFISHLSDQPPLTVYHSP